jgi:hypothetical protein
MAVCEDCGQDMLQVTTCKSRSVMTFRGDVFKPVAYGSETIWPGRLIGRCGDCGVVAGGIHHFGCDMEQCPRCGEQLIGCDCVEEFDLHQNA